MALLEIRMLLAPASRRTTRDAGAARKRSRNAFTTASTSKIDKKSISAHETGGHPYELGEGGAHEIVERLGNRDPHHKSREALSQQLFVRARESNGIVAGS